MKLVSCPVGGDFPAGCHSLRWLPAKQCSCSREGCGVRYVWYGCGFEGLVSFCNVNCRGALNFGGWMCGVCVEDLVVVSVDR